MKSTEKSIDGVKYHDIGIRATPNQMIALTRHFKAHFRFDNYGSEETNFETEFETSQGGVFTVYDWNEGVLDQDKLYDFHIGAHSKGVAVLAQSEVYREVNNSEYIKMRKDPIQYQQQPFL